VQTSIGEVQREFQDLVAQSVIDQRLDFGRIPLC